MSEVMTAPTPDEPREVEDVLDILSNLANDGNQQDIIDRCRKQIANDGHIQPPTRHTLYKLSQKYKNDLDANGITVVQVPSVGEAIKKDISLLENDEVISYLGWLREKEKLSYEIALKEAGISGEKNNMRQALEAELSKRSGDPKDTDDSITADVPEDVKLSARRILHSGSPMSQRMKYVSRRVSGNDEIAMAVAFSAASAYLDGKRVHVDITGSSQGGKTLTTDEVIETFPPEDILRFTHVSSMSLYYYARDCIDSGVSLDHKIIIINDASREHIPFLKVARDDCAGNPRSLTVVNGESVMLEIPGHPVIQTSSVMPLRDFDGQAISRAFLAPVQDTNKEEEVKVKQKIRSNEEYGELRRDKDDTERDILREMSRIIRDEGVHRVIIPFDPSEPKGADRRGTGQFMRLIKISAHENQFQRPIMEMLDGTKYILATYTDLKNAAALWFKFEGAQSFKITHKTFKVFKELPTNEPPHDHRAYAEYQFGQNAPSINWLSEKTKIGAKSVSRYLNDLVEVGLAYSKQVQAPGNPYVFWTTKDLRQNVMSQISTSGDGEGASGQIETKSGCPKYMAKNCPVCLKTSLSSFFTNKDIIRQEMIEGIHFPGGEFVPSDEIFSSSLSRLENCVLNTPNAATDSVYSGQSEMSERSEMPHAIGSDFVQRTADIVQEVTS